MKSLIFNLESSLNNFKVELLTHDQKIARMFKEESEI
jgi:hypothetical protein